MIPEDKGLVEISQRKGKMQREERMCAPWLPFAAISISFNLLYIYIYIYIYIYTHIYIFQFCTVLDILHLQSHLLFSNIYLCMMGLLTTLNKYALSDMGNKWP